MCSQEEDLLRALLNPCDFRFLLSSDNDNSYEDVNLLEDGDLPQSSSTEVRDSEPADQDQRSNLGISLQSIQSTLERMNKRIDELSGKISNRESRDSTPSRITTPDPGQALIQPTQGSSREWAERPVGERPDYLNPVIWPDEESIEDTGHRPLIQVSEDTTKYIKTVFKRPANNTIRLQHRKGYSFPDIEDTKCPKLDPVIKQNLGKETKDTDSGAAKLQTLTLDAMAPLVYITEEAQKGTLCCQKAADAAKAAIALIGNASAQMSKERRKKILKELNRDLVPLAENAEMFDESAPLLFGNSFEKRMKEHVDSLRCLRNNSTRQNCFFSKGRSAFRPRGGGRGRGHYSGQSHRYQPFHLPRFHKKNFQDTAKNQ